MGEDIGAVKRQLERQEDSMTTSLARDSVPDEEKSRDSLGSRLPKPIGYGRPSTTRAAPNTIIYTGTIEGRAGPIVGPGGAMISLYHISADNVEGFSRYMYAVGYNVDAILPCFATVNDTIGPETNSDVTATSRQNRYQGGEGGHSKSRR